MRILNISGSGCSRFIKEGLAVQELGHEVLFLSNEYRNQSILPQINLLSYFDSNKENLKNKLELFRGVDIVHVHAEPFWLPSFIKDIFPNTKVICDIHDSDKIRYDRDNEHEISAYKDCDAFIFPSKLYRNELKQLFKFKTDLTEIVYNKSHESVARMRPMPKIGGVAYQGGLTDETMPHRDYRELACWFSILGIPFHLHFSNKVFARSYANTGALLYSPLPFYNLMSRLTRYDWGLAASPNDKNPDGQWLKSAAHKFYEYAACGLPVVTWGESEMADVIRDTGCGYVFDNREHFLKNYNMHKDIRADLENKRELFTMSTEGQKIVDFYEDVLDG